MTKQQHPKYLPSKYAVACVAYGEGFKHLYQIYECKFHADRRDAEKNCRELAEENPTRVYAIMKVEELVSAIIDVQVVVVGKPGWEASGPVLAWRRHAAA